MQFILTKSEQIQKVLGYLARLKFGKTKKGDEIGYLCEIKRKRDIRSLKQNARYWVLCKLAGDHISGYDKDEMHYWFRMMYHYEEKKMPNGQVEKIPLSTTIMDTKEMAEYQDKIINMLRTEFGFVWEYGEDEYPDIPF